MTDIDVSFLVNTGRIFSKMDFNYGSYQPASSLLHHENMPEEDEDDDLDSFYMDMPPIDMVERLKEVNKAHIDDPTPVECDRLTKLRFKDIIAEFQSPRESESDDGYGDSSDIMYDPEEEIDNLCEATKDEKIFDSNIISKDSEVVTRTNNLNFEGAKVDTRDSNNTEAKINDSVTHIMNCLKQNRENVECTPKTKILLEEDKNAFCDEYEDDFEEDVADVLKPADSKDHKINRNKSLNQISERKWKRNRNRIGSGNVNHNMSQDINRIKSNELHTSIIDKNIYRTNEQSLYNPAPKIDHRKSLITNGTTKCTDLTQIYKVKPNPLGLSSSQPIPKPKLMFSPYQLSCSSTGPILMGSKNNSSRSKSMARSSLNPACLPNLPNKLKIQKSPSHKNRPVGPIKAIHDSSIFSNDLCAEILADSQSHMERRLRPRTKVWKSASTTDLHRQDQEFPREISDYAYSSWLQQKRRAAVAAKKEKENLRQTKESEAAVKYSERKQLAEEAFQQWLKKKKEQLQLEKKFKLQQRKLDFHTNYANTSNQCDDAYKEWYKRKQEEMALRKSTGTSMRSRSLERTWMQEKTRKLYNAYLPHK